MAKTRQMDEQITHDIIDQHGLYARFGVERMTVDRFTQIFYMVWKAVEDALDLTRNLRCALDPFDDGAEEAAIEMTPNYLDFYRGLFLASEIVQNGHSELLDLWYWWNDLPQEEKEAFVEKMNRIYELQVKGRAELRELDKEDDEGLRGESGDSGPGAEVHSRYVVNPRLSEKIRKIKEAQQHDKETT